MFRVVELVLALFLAECISSRSSNDNDNKDGSAKRKVGELKMCLLELFQSALLCPRVKNRFEALRLVKRVGTELLNGLNNSVPK